MVLDNNGQNALAGNQPFGSAQGMLQHRTSADKIYILLWKRAFSQRTDKRPQAFALPAGQNEAAKDSIIVVGNFVFLIHSVNRKTKDCSLRLHVWCFLSEMPLCFW